MTATLERGPLAYAQVKLLAYSLSWITDINPSKPGIRDTSERFRAQDAGGRGLRSNATLAVVSRISPFACATPRLSTPFTEGASGQQCGTSATSELLSPSDTGLRVDSTSLGYLRIAACLPGLSYVGVVQRVGNLYHLVPTLGVDDLLASGSRVSPAWFPHRMGGCTTRAVPMWQPSLTHATISYLWLEIWRRDSQCGRWSTTVFLNGGRASQHLNTKRPIVATLISFMSIQ